MDHRSRSSAREVIIRLFDRQRMRQPYSCGLVGLRRVIFETLTVTKIQPQVGQGAPERLQLAPGVRSRTSTAGLLSQPGQAKHDREYRKKHNKTLKSTPVLTRGEWSLRFLCMRVLQGFASAGRLNSMLGANGRLVVRVMQPLLRTAENRTTQTGTAPSPRQRTESFGLPSPMAQALQAVELSPEVR
jgi:hypothetical protein